MPPSSPEQAFDPTADAHRVLVAGEALIDVIHRDGTTREHPGGSPANVALGLARLGVATSFLTAVGDDARGHAISERLTGAGVTLLPESWSLPTTSSAEARITADGSAAYEFDITWQLPRRIAVPPVRHLHIGSISAFLAPGADRIEQLVEELRPEASISFDPNIRPALVGDRADAVARFERLARRADIVKLSDEDALFLYPDVRADEAARAISSTGALVAVTRGSAGSILTAGGSTVEIAPVTVQVVDTVGAGDSYMAALLAWFLEAGLDTARGLSPAELASAGQSAARAAGITVSRAGAEPPTSAELAG
ncbi:fructokinase [Leifsonia sp. LS1]|uniref:carbohydrate kinase family protein n=1 Tax=Leifsonia sp. LS1 TaxID=2828483 RepID=UPI001CFE34FF|nr:carbohydrate kinase [Leifsonia sp. LS1]GIT81295.1 fructokinase [Leifsonia sp. LS1]